MGPAGESEFAVPSQAPKWVGSPQGYSAHLSSLELDPTEDKTETQGPERGPPRMALESRSEGGWVL